jgi:hypothetical protein
MRRSLTEAFYNTGYDLEGLYFHELNQKAIEALHQRKVKNKAPKLALVAAPPASRERHYESWLGRMLDMLMKPRPTGVGQFPV